MEKTSQKPAHTVDKFSLFTSLSQVKSDTLDPIPLNTPLCVQFCLVYNLSGLRICIFLVVAKTLQFDVFSIQHILVCTVVHVGLWFVIHMSHA